MQNRKHPERLKFKDIPAAVLRTEAFWREQEAAGALTPFEFEVTRSCGTERAFANEFWDHKKTGTYLCRCCGLELFASSTKFDSGTGWPSFWEPVAEGVIESHEDRAYGMLRIESRCARCGAHLGHVFPDGPEPTGERYCINSAALEFVPD